MNQTIDYAPRRRGGITNRLLVVLFGAAAACVVVGNAVADPVHGSFAGLWLMGGYLLGASSAFIALIRWIVRGSGR